MAAYCTQDDLVTLFGQAEISSLADRDGDGEIDAPVVAAAIAAASNEIDSYIGARYALPLQTVPGSLKGVCLHLAHYALFTSECTQLVAARRDAAIAWLKDISRGVAALDVPAPASADATQTGNQIRIEPGDRRVSRAELRRL